MKYFFRSERAIIAVAFVFVLVMIGFNVYNLGFDSTSKKAYTADDIEKIEVELININEADIGALCELPEVGESTAKKIIEYREEHGGFKSVEELKEVSGIGEQTYIKIFPLITV